MTTSSLLTRIPENTSFLQANKFTFAFDTLPFLKYFCQNVALPSISTSAVTVSSPFADMYRHGDKLNFSELNVSVLIDEDLRVWEETYNWLQALTKPDNFRQYFRQDRSDKRNRAYHDATLTLNTNANNPNMRFKFTECHPVALSGIQFSTMETAASTLTADITFRYDQFYLERL